MKLRLITLTMNPDTGGFPSEPLADIEGEVVSVSEHFFVHGGMPQLLLIVHYREKTNSGGERVQRGKSPVKPADPGIRAVLSDPEKVVFDRLRAWRNGKAQSEGVPPYVLLTNQQLADIVRRHPTTLGELREVEGIGESKAARLGRELLGMMKLFDGEQPALPDARAVPTGA